MYLTKGVGGVFGVGRNARPRSGSFGKTKAIRPRKKRRDQKQNGRARQGGAFSFSCPFGGGSNRCRVVLAITRHIFQFPSSRVCSRFLLPVTSPRFSSSSTEGHKCEYEFHRETRSIFYVISCVPVISHAVLLAQPYLLRGPVLQSRRMHLFPQSPSFSSNLLHTP